MFSSKKRIKFVRGNFTNPILGNVWEGRVATLDKKTANKFIETNYAIDYTDEEQGDIAYEAKLTELRAAIGPPVTGTTPTKITEDDEDFLELEDEDDDETEEESEGDATDETAKARLEAAEKTGEEGENIHTPVSLEDALKRLNPDDDAHWTKAGLPDLNVLKEIMHQPIKRADVEAAAPDFNRDVAREVKG